MNRLGRVPGVLVGKRIHRHVGKLRLDLLGDVIDKRQHAPRRATLGLVNRPALRTLARPVAVVLGHRDDLRVGRLAQPLLHPLHHKVAQLGVGQAKLCIVVRPLALDEAVPFGMRGEILLRGHQRVKGVAETLVLDAAAQRLWNEAGWTICAIVRLPLRVEPGEPIRVAILKCRPAPDIQIRHAQVPAIGESRRLGRPPTHSALVLQEAIHRVERPSRPAAGQQQASSLHLHH